MRNQMLAGLAGVFTLGFGFRYVTALFGGSATLGPGESNSSA